MGDSLRLFSLESILWPNSSPILVTFGKMQFSRFQRSNFLFLHLPYKAF